MYTPVQVTKKAIFPGGEADLIRFVRQHLTYPEQARLEAAEGRVVVMFEIDETGQVVNAQVVKGIGYGCDEEVLRVVHQMPRWTPALLNGEQVAMSFTLPVRFDLTNI